MPRRGTNIYKRKDGRWEARYVSAVGIDGKKKYASVYAATYREAKDKQLQCIQNIHISIDAGVNATLEETMWMWLATTVNTVKPSTFQKYESMIRNHIANGLGQTQLKFISSQMIDQYAREKMQGKNALSPKTVNDILAIIGLAMSFAEQEYGYTKPRIRRVKEERKEMRVLSLDEQKVLEKHLLSDLDLYKLGVLIALYSGLRVGELCALHWDDIKDDRIYVNKSYRRIKAGSSTVLEVSTPKTAASVRTIPILTHNEHTQRDYYMYLKLYASYYREDSIDYKNYEYYRPLDVAENELLYYREIKSILAEINQGVVD